MNSEVVIYLSLMKRNMPMTRNITIPVAVKPSKEETKIKTK